MTREQMRDAIVAEHGGQDILTAPIDKGFNRLAWFFPYAVGVVGAVGDRCRREALVALRAGRPRPRAPHRRTPLSREGWMMSSATSTRATDCTDYTEGFSDS